MKIKQGQKAPFGYGYAWSNFYSETGGNTREVYIVPLNWIFAWLREIWLFIRRGRKDRRLIASQYWHNKGWQKGYKEGIIMGKRQKKGS